MTFGPRAVKKFAAAIPAASLPKPQTGFLWRRKSRPKAAFNPRI